MANVKYALLFLLSCGGVQAEEDVRTLGDLDRLQSGRVYYDAQAAFNKAKMAAGLADTAMTPVVSPSPAGQGGAFVTAPSVSALPALAKITGAVATLDLADGTSAQVRAGDSMAGGYSVVSVSLRGVVIRRTRDGHLFTLN